jgi:hypothetical protein
MKKNDTNVKDAIVDIAKSLEVVFKKYSKNTREKAWDKITSKDGEKEIKKIIVDPSRPVNTFQKLATQKDESFKNWLENINQSPGTTKFNYNNIGPDMKQSRKIPVRDFEYEDELGGSATGWIKGRLASITRMDSVPIDKKYSPEESNLKRRGFFKKLLHELSKLQVREIEIGLQSYDTQKAIARLIEKRILEEIPQKSLWGDRFTKYKINIGNLTKDLNA